MKQLKLDFTICLFFLMTTLVLIFNLNTENFFGIPAYLWSNAAIVIFAAWTLATVIKTNGFLLWDKVFTWMILFVLMCLLSVSYSYARGDSWRKTATMAVVFVMAISIYQYIAEENHLRMALKAYAWAGFLAAIYLLSNSSIEFSDIERIGDEIGDANLVGITFALAATVSIHLLRTENIWYRWVYAVQIVIMLISIMLTGSRTAFILIVVAIILNLIFSAYKNQWNILKVVLLMVVVVAIIFAFYYAVMNIRVLYDVLGIRLLSFTQIMRGEDSVINEGSTQRRGLFARRAFEWWLNSPIFVGHGIGAFASYNQTFANGWYCFCHCGYLEVLCGTGIPGVILFYGSYIRFLASVVTKTVDRIGVEYCILLGTLTIEFLLGEIFLVTYYEKSTWILFALMAGIYTQIKNRSQIKSYDSA